MTETSIETKRQYLGAIEDLADRLRRDLELAVSKAEPATIATPCGAVSDDMPMLACVLAEGHPGLHAYGSADRDLLAGTKRVAELETENEQLDRLLKAAEASMRHMGDDLAAERQGSAFLDAKLQERDRQIEALDYELGETKRQLAHRDETIQALVRRINAIRIATDLSAETD